MRTGTASLTLSLAATLTVCTAHGVFAAHKKSAVEKPPVVTVAGLGDIDQRISAAEADVARLTASLEQLKQDSAKAASDAISLKASAQAKAAPIESLYAQKTQELAASNNQRDKARRDSIALAIKRISLAAAQKQEAARMDAALLAASNQLNALSLRRQQIPAQESGGESKAAAAMERDVVRADSAIAAKQAQKVDWAKNLDQLHQDSLAAESKAYEVRSRIQFDGRRVDSLLQIASGFQADAVGKQTKSRELMGTIAAQQARFGECQRAKAVTEAQLTRIKGDIAAISAQRDRLRAAADASQKKLDQDRRPLTDALAAAEAKLQEKNDERDGCASLSQKVRLDSAIQKAKDALNAAIEQQAMGKKGAEKMVSQREAEVADLMGQLDDVVRKNPKLTQVSGLLSGLSTTAEKRRRIDSLTAAFTADIAALTLQRDRARRFLQDFDRAHPAAASGRSTALLDSMLTSKEQSATAMQARRDSIENQVVASQRTVETLSATMRAETAKADSAASVARKQHSDRIAQRAQVRTDSIKNESGLMVALVGLRAQQLNIAAQCAALDRDIANLGAAKQRLKQSIIDAENRDKQMKAANQLERKRLDSLIGAKEREVAQLSTQNENANRQAQAAIKDIDLLIQKQVALIASTVPQVDQAQQECTSVFQQVDAARKQCIAAEKAGLDTIRSIQRDKAAIAAALAARKTELAGLRSQRETLRRGLTQELSHLDSMISAAGKVIAAYEGLREKARQDSASAEASKSEAQLKSISALRTLDSLGAAKQQQLLDASMILEKARQDSAVKSTPIAGEVDRAMKVADSIVALKERQLADAREQREKARMNQIAEQRRQFAVVVAAHQEVVNCRAQLEQKRTEAALLQSQRKKLQQDSAAAAARYQAVSRASGNEALRQAGLMQQKNYELSALQAQRSDCAAKLAAMGADAAAAPRAQATLPPAPAAVPPAAASEQAGQKQVEEIYQLISANKTDEAVARFNTLREVLAKTVGPEAFETLKNTIEQLSQAQKISNVKKN